MTRMHKRPGKGNAERSAATLSRTSNVSRGREGRNVSYGNPGWIGSARPEGFTAGRRRRHTKNDLTKRYGGNPFPVRSRESPGFLKGHSRTPAFRTSDDACL
ncbi:hypothetical protein MTO96_039288 [Rhipicephalus appendiculatus]